MNVIKKNLKKIIIAVLVLSISAILLVLLVDGYVRSSTKDRILTQTEAKGLEDLDCILILGCGLRQDGTPSKLLTDRLMQGIALYNEGVAPKLLMSGDHGQVEYDEVNAMKAFAIEQGVPSSDVFMDHAGFSTYESIYRAGAIFQADKVVIVTQEYHLYRALHIARRLGIDAYGVASDNGTHPGATYRELREKLARTKDFLWVTFRPQPTYLGEAIPVGGNGDTTND